MSARAYEPPDSCPMTHDIDLVDAGEIAARARVDPRTVHVWRRRYPDFPQPEWRLRVGPVWQWPPVQAWLQHTGRLRE